jgi:hypothetical protein
LTIIYEVHFQLIGYAIMANNLQHAPYSLLDDQRSFSSMGSGERMSIYDYFTLREEQPPLDVDPSAPFHDRDPGLYLIQI